MNFELESFNTTSEQLQNFDSDTLLRFEANTEIALIIDEFEDIKTIQFNSFGMGICDNEPHEFPEYFKLYSPNESAYYFLGFTLVNHNEFSYMNITIRDRNINLAMGDYLIILFEDGHKIKHTFGKSRTGNQYHSSNIIPLDKSILTSLLSRNISKVKVVSKRKNIYSVYQVNNKLNEGESVFKFSYTNRTDGQLLLKFMTYKFIDFNLKNKI